LNDPAYHRDAMFHYCMGFMNDSTNSQEALECTRQLVAEMPDSKYAWQMRARTLFSAGDRGALEAADRYIALADPDQPMDKRQIEQYRHLGQRLRAYLGDKPGGPAPTTQPAAAPGQ
jgi:predicted Zn-dependent protease